jgi:GntR family transcriptional regulator
VGTPDFYRRYGERASARSTKHEALKEAISAAIADGFWGDGAQLPTETEFTRMTPFSLGTVQRAIGSLVNEGLVQRRRGLGTFVVPREKRIGGPWIWQFLTPDETGFIPMTTRVIRREEIRPEETWARWLTDGLSEQRVLQIDRIIHAGDYGLASRFHADPMRFPVLKEAPIRTLHGENFAGLIQRVYGVSPSVISRSMHCADLPAFACDLLGIAKGSIGMHVELMAKSARGMPIFHNTMYLPPGGPKIFFQDRGT